MVCGITKKKTNININNKPIEEVGTRIDKKELSTKEKQWSYLIYLSK